MTINISIGSKSNTDQEPQKPHVEPNQPGNMAKLNMRRSLDNQLLIFPHQDIDVIINQKNGKILTVGTDHKVSDRVYDSQNRFFKMLIKRGIVDPASVRMGNVYGCLEGVILTPSDSNVNRYDVALRETVRWIEQEQPDFTEREFRKKERVEDLTDPEDKDSTELGKVKQKKTQGSGVGSPGNAGGHTGGSSQNPY
jgi:hypothetical protein